MELQKYPQNVQNTVNALLTQGSENLSNVRRRVMEYTMALSTGKQALLGNDAFLTEWKPYIDTVTQHAYRITDSHIAHLKDIGHSEDEIFELTVSAALGSGLARLEQGLAAIE
ncbi:MAG: hypothetical protein AAF702_07150 [Chloroflexota bacterium]